MDLKKFDKQLSKINGLITAISEDGVANSIERDLLKSYILKLYELLESDGEVVKSSPKPTAKKPTRAKKAPAKKVSAPVVEEIEEEIEEEEEIVEVAPVKEKVVEKPAAKVEPVVEKKTIDDDSPMHSLFAEFSSKEVGDKLSQRAIKDLTKAWSINEKIFTIKELFAGDSEKFRETLRELNDLADFAAAKNHLMNGVAAKYGWDSENNFKKARNFIKLIKRRYN